MSSQNDAENRPNDAQSAVMHSVLAVDSQDYSVEGQKLRLHAFITEVTEITPSKLANALAARIQQTLVKTIDKIGQGYVTKARERVSNIQEVRDFAEGKFYELSVTLRNVLTQAVAEVEKFMTDETFHIDLELYTGGFLRFQHHEGIDYTDVAGAHELEAQVSTAEAELDSTLKELVQLRAREQYLDTLVAECERLDQWLEGALAGGELVKRADQVRELTTVVNEGMAALREVIDKMTSGGIANETDASR